MREKKASKVRRDKRTERPSVPRSATVHPQAIGPSQSRALWIICAILIVMNLAVYSAVRHHDFVSFDDPQYVSENPNISAGLTAQGIQWAFTTGYASNWHPLTWISHMLDIQMFGLNAGAQHVVNLAFHIANTLLLFAILYSMTGALERSGFVAALFAVHPLHVESVAWISERKDVLSTLFWMLTIWAYVAYTRKPRAARYALVMLLFGFGLMAKPMIVTLPFVLVLLDVWPLARAEFRWAALVKSLVEKLPLIALAAVSSIVTFAVQLRGSVSGLDAVSLGMRIANALTSYVLYIAKTLWPVKLAVLYPFPQSIPAWQVIASLALLAGITVAVFRHQSSHSYLLVGWLWFLGTLVPVIGLVQVGSQSMADRYAYVPLIGLAVIAAWGLPDLAARMRMHSSVLTAAALVVLVACMWSSRQQVAYWSDSLKLWSRALEVTNGNYRAHVALGSLLQQNRKGQEAATHYQEALRLKPNFAEAHNKLGTALDDQGNTSEAISHYVEAIRQQPDFPEAHYNLGNAATRLGRTDEAIRHYKDALRLRPDDALFHNGLGSALDDKGQVSEALAEYNEALRIKPDLAAVHNNMAATLIKEQKFSEAVQHLLEAIRIQPNDPDFQYNAAVALQQMGRGAEARQHLEAALKINPGHQGARAALGSLR